MDWRRSCSKTFMQVERPSEGQYLMPVIWYVAPVGAKTYLLPQSFSGGIWDYDKIALPPLLGEQPPYASPWYNGRNAWDYRGQCVVGTPDQYQNGLSAKDLAAPPPRLLACCLGRETAYGGVIVGGVAATQGVGPERARGGVQLGGVAASQQGYAVPTRGGVVLGGKTRTHSAFAGPARGGVVLGGVSRSRSPVAHPTRGGVVLGGLVRTLSPRAGRARGGVVLGGAAVTQQSSPVRARGGVQLGGVAVTQGGAVVPTTGGVQLGGVVSTQQGYAIPTRGGVVLGGLVGTQPGFAAPTRGGVVLGGLVGVQSGLIRSTGGVVLGGVAASQPALSLGQKGGVVLGGVVSIATPPVATTKGGVVLGGVATTAGGSTAGIFTLCCPLNPTPPRLFAHFSGASNPVDNQTIPVDYDSLVGFWHDDGSYHFGICTGVVNIVCASLIGGAHEWRFEGNEFGFGWSIAPTGIPDCAAFSLVFDLTAWAVQLAGCYAPDVPPLLLTVNGIP